MSFRVTIIMWVKTIIIMLSVCRDISAGDHQLLSQPLTVVIHKVGGERDEWRSACFPFWLLQCWFSWVDAATSAGCLHGLHAALMTPPCVHFGSSVRLMYRMRMKAGYWLHFFLIFLNKYWFLKCEPCSKLVMVNSDCLTFPFVSCGFSKSVKKWTWVFIFMSLLYPPCNLQKVGKSVWCICLINISWTSWWILLKLRK